MEAAYVNEIDKGTGDPTPDGRITTEYENDKINKT